MTLRTIDFEDARQRGLFRHARSYLRVEPDLFLVRGKSAFYVRAFQHEIEELRIREERDRLCI